MQVYKCSDALLSGLELMRAIGAVIDSPREFDSLIIGPFCCSSPNSVECPETQSSGLETQMSGYEDSLE